MSKFHEILFYFNLKNGSIFIWFSEIFETALTVYGALKKVFVVNSGSLTTLADKLCPEFKRSNCRIFLIKNISCVLIHSLRSRCGTVARVLASHQSALGSLPGHDVMCGLSLLLVLLLLQGFSRSIPLLKT